MPNRAVKLCPKIKTMTQRLTHVKPESGVRFQQCDSRGLQQLVIVVNRYLTGNASLFTANNNKAITKIRLTVSPVCCSFFHCFRYRQFGMFHYHLNHGGSVSKLSIFCSGVVNSRLTDSYQDLLSNFRPKSKVLKL